MGVRDNLHVVGMALSVELECTFHGHAMNPVRMLHELCKHDSTSDVSGLKYIPSPDGIAVCRVHMGWPELHRRDHKQSYDRLSTHGLTGIRLQLAIYLCLHRGSLPENTARRQALFQGDEHITALLKSPACSCVSITLPGRVVNANHGVPIRLAKLARFLQNSAHMKTTTLPLRNLMNRSPLRAFLLIPFVLACFGLSPQARAVCQEGCDLSNNNTF